MTDVTVRGEARAPGRARRTHFRSVLVLGGALFSPPAAAGGAVPAPPFDPVEAPVRRGGFPAATVSFEAASGTWRIGNALVEKRIRLNPDGHVVTTLLRDVARGLSWTQPSLRAPEFRLVVEVAGPEEPHTTRGPIELSGGTSWQLEEHLASVDGDGTARLEIRLASLDAPVAVTLHSACAPESPVLRSWVEVENRDTLPLVLAAADSVVLRFRGSGAPLSLFGVNNFNWSHPDDSFTTLEELLTPGRAAVLRTGPWANQAAWFALRDDARNAGVFGGWEWSGSGDLDFEAGADAAVSFRMGLRTGTFSKTLPPGGRFASPVGFVGVFSGGWDGAGAATRDFVERRIAPPLPAPDFPWAGFDTWGYGEGIDAPTAHQLIDVAADLGLEFFTLDAGWMMRLGEWVPKPDAFEQGIEVLSAHAHARGLRFGIWMGFGAADAQSPVARDHPDWLARDANGPITTDFGGWALCLGDPRVREWILAEVDRVVGDYGVDWLLRDFTVITRCTDLGHTHGAGDGEWASTAGYYAVLDELRRRHPKLILENCWDGGNMFDFGMVARHDTSATNDRNNAFGNRQAVFGATYLVPPRYIDKYVGDDGTGDAYRFLSGVPGGPLILMGFPTAWQEETIEAARSAVAFFKSARPVLRDGEVFHLTPDPGIAGVDAIQSYSAAHGRGFVFAYRHAAGEESSVLFPAGLEGSALFDVTIQTSVLPGAPARSLPVATGDELMWSGVAVGLAEDQSVAVVTIQRR